MSSIEGKYAFRSAMVDALVTDLLGPESDDEILDERPLERYVTGILWPASGESLEALPDEPDGAESGPDDAHEDSPIASTRMSYPSSVGLTFTVDTGEATLIRVLPRAARYLPHAKGQDEDLSQRRLRFDWRRVPLETDEIIIDVTVTGQRSLELGQNGLELYVLCRPADKNGHVTVTAVLKNRMKAPKSSEGDKDLACWFQVGMDVRTEKPAFVDRASKRALVFNDPDLASADLLYRNARTYAAGHGCAGTWDVNNVEKGRIALISSTFLPRQEVPRALASGTKANLSLGFLATADRDPVVRELALLVTSYRQWIDDRASDVRNSDPQDPESIPRHMTATAEGHISEARKTADRIAAGIDLLQTSDEAFRSFQLANRAMQIQRSRQDWVRDHSKEPFILSEDQHWRPFQIAFVLLNLPGLTDESHQDRDIADLLWFPTGGGKTEAYLGLIAYTIVLRRLRDPDASGVAVLMRYTLRLLTIQQFERAAMLICSLEAVRKEFTELGSASFSIGLWVGGAATPNNIAVARSNLGKIRRNTEVEEGNPMQLEACPWCGAILGIDDYQIVKNPDESMRISCSDNTCQYHKGLPVHIVDTDVYRMRPELIIGTVDKFALMAWKEEVAKLFGRSPDGDGYGPDLIIQDELHLISGPLGSTVGLFETAIDFAAGDFLRSDSTGKRRPKVVASTATIRRARAQINAVFDRESGQFPPPGLDPEDSFFAKRAPREVYGTREYVGVMAAGTSHATLLVRVYASLLQSALRIKSDDPADRDPYWTMLGYFNSLRVLGSAYLQVHDDVRARLAVISKRTGDEAARDIQQTELTSRVSSRDIPGRLKSLETGLGDSRKPQDVVLATNMISVGLDVDRLGLMTVMGQPQSSAEYIQATSRVGRKHPGLVVTILNSARSRDRSHFESFIPFHQAVYRAVEATSATPFAARSRDRALHAVLVAAVRMLQPDMASDGAAKFAQARKQEILAVARGIIARVKRVAPDEAEATATELDRLIDLWASDAAAKETIRYSDIKNRGNSLLISSSTALEDNGETYDTQQTPWPTPQSMRDVDAETTLKLTILKAAKHG